MDYFLGLLSFILIAPFAYIVYRYGRSIHKHEERFYVVTAIFAVLLTIAAIFAQVFDRNLAVESPVIYALFFQGHTAFALYVLVMFAGAFKHKSKPKTTLMMVRRELAIIGFILLVPHVVLLIWTALTNYNPTGTIAFLIMIPLFITSFKHIRKKMKPLQWKKLHRLAYAAYAVIYLHVASITVIFNLLFSETTADLIFGFVRFTLYTIIFGFYTYLKFKNYILVDNTNKQPKKALN